MGAVPIDPSVCKANLHSAQSPTFPNNTKRRTTKKKRLKTHLTRLPYPMRSAHRLQIVLWIPVRVENDNLKRLTGATYTAVKMTECNIGLASTTSNAFLCKKKTELLLIKNALSRLFRLFFMRLSLFSPADLMYTCGCTRNK